MRAFELKIAAAVKGSADKVRFHYSIRTPVLLLRPLLVLLRKSMWFYCGAAFDLPAAAAQSLAAAAVHR